MAQVERVRMGAVPEVLSNLHQPKVMIWLEVARRIIARWPRRPVARGSTRQQPRRKCSRPHIRYQWTAIGPPSRADSRATGKLTFMIEAEQPPSGRVLTPRSTRAWRRRW